MAPAENTSSASPKKIAIVAPTQPVKNNDSDDEIQIIHEHINRSKPKNPRKKNNNEILTLRHGLGVPSQCYEIVKDICSFKGGKVDRQRTILYSRNQISHASSSSLADTIREVVPNVLESIVYKEEIKHTSKSKDNDNATPPSFAETSSSNVTEEFMDLHDNNIDFDDPPSPPTTATVEESMNLDDNNIAIDVPPSSTVSAVTEENVNVIGNNDDFVNNHPIQEEVANSNNMEHDCSSLLAPSCSSSEAKDCNGADDQCNVDPKENFGLPETSAVMSCSSFQFRTKKSQLYLRL